MKLARSLGRNLRELYATTDSAELTKWEALDMIEPWGDDWQQAATICSAVFQAMTGSRIPWPDFVPTIEFQRDTAAEARNMSQQKSIVAAALQAMAQQTE